MPYILGQHNVLFFGSADNPTCQRWWEEGGFIHMEDSRDNFVRIYTVREFLLRLQKLNELVSSGKKVENRGFANSQEVNRVMTFIEDGQNLARKALKTRADLETEAKAKAP